MIGIRHQHHWMLMSKCIFYVFYFGLAIRGTNHGDKIETDILIDVAEFDVVVSGLLQITDFLITYGNFRIGKRPVATCLDFDEDHFVMLSV